MANTLLMAETGSIRGNEGKSGSLRKRRQMEESHSFSSLKVSSERQRQERAEEEGQGEERGD